MKTLAELLALRAEIIDKMTALNEGTESFSKEQDEEYGLLELDLEDTDKQISRKEKLIAAQASTAVPHTPEGTPSAPKAIDPLRLTISATMQKEKGIRFAQWVRAMAASQGDMVKAHAWAIQAFGKDYDVSKALEWGSAPGDNLVPVDFYDEVIELLRNMTVIRKLNPRTVGMPHGNMTLPRQNGSASATYIGENTPIDADDASFEQFTMTAKKIMGVTSITNELLRYNAYNVDGLVRDDLLEVIALTEDSQMLRGTGSAIAPTSLLEMATGAGGIYAAVDEEAPSIQDIDTQIGALILHLQERNVPLGDATFIMAPRTKMFLENKRDGNGNKAYPEIAIGELRGYPVLVSNQVPSNIGTNTDETEIYFTTGAQLLLADTRRMEMMSTNTGSYQVSGALISTFANDVTAIRLISEHDFNARHLEAIAVLEAVRWGADVIPPP